MYHTQPLVTQPSLTIIDSSSSTNRDHPFLPLRRLPLLVPPLINPSSLQLPFRQSLPLQLSHPFNPPSLSAQTLSHLPSALSSSRSCARCACRPSGGESDQTESADETSLSERPTRADPDRAVHHSSQRHPSRHVSLHNLTDARSRPQRRRRRSILTPRAPANKPVVSLIAIPPILAPPALQPSNRHLSPHKPSPISLLLSPTLDLAPNVHADLAEEPGIEPKAPTKHH